MDTPKRIVMVEDDASDAEMTMRALAPRLAGEILRLRDGAEALEFLFRRGQFSSRWSGNPALVLLDLKMPKVDGLEVLRQIKSDAVLRTIPIVVMTSSREDSDLRKAYQLGVNAYVVKPVQFAEFADAVRQVGAFWGILNEPPPGTTPRVI